jgi:outer membrane protein assembly factor BamB
MTFTAQAPPGGYRAGDRAMGGTLRATDRGYGALRAIDPVTGERKWELRHPTPSRAGVLSTSGRVVFSGDSEGDVSAAGSRTGKELWRDQVGASLYAAPSTYHVHDRHSPVRRRPGRNDAHGVRSPSTLSLAYNT